MNCEEVREHLSDFHEGRLDPDMAGSVDEHVARCEECRRALQGMREMYGLLGSIEPSPASAAPTRRFAQLMEAYQLGQAAGAASRTRSPRSYQPRWLAMVATLLFVIGGALGYGLRDWRPAPGAVLLHETDSEYVLLVSSAGDASARTSPVETRARVQEYREWAGALEERGKLISAEKLDDARGWSLRNRDSRTEVVSRPPQRGNQVIGGFFVVRAADDVEALEIARSCPHLVHGGDIELRAIERTTPQTD